MSLRGPRVKYDAKMKAWKIGSKPLLAATQAVSKFAVPFDRDYWAEKKAKERGVDPSVVIAEWEEKGRVSRQRGKDLHAAVAAYFEGGSRKGGCLYSQQALRACRELEMRSFAIEARVGSDRLGVTGVVDFLGWVRGRRCMVEWKTSTIETKNRVNQKMLPPVEHLQDCSWTHACLQIGLYQQVLQDSYELDLLPGAVVEVSEDGYRVLDVPDMREDVSRILGELQGVAR